MEIDKFSIVSDKIIKSVAEFKNKDICKDEFNLKLLMVLSNAFFSPKSYQTGIITKTEQTYSIHHFAASWVNKYDNLPLYAKMWKFLHLPDTNIRERFFKKKK